MNGKNEEIKKEGIKIEEIRFAICDDNPTDVEYLSSVVKEWAEKQNCNIVIHTFLSAENFLFHYAEQKDYDCLLLDIEMGQMDGVTMAKKIRHENESVQIIFVTGYSDYISEGYEVAALHYLMKPIHKEKLFEVLNRAKDKLKRNEKVLLLEQGGEMVRLPIYEIHYIEVRQNYITYHAKADYTVKKSLSEAEKELDERFFRIGRSYIVNLTYIRRITRSEVHLNNEEILPLPRGMYEPLNRAVIQMI